MIDHAAAAQQAAEERLAACQEAFDAECVGDENAEDLWPEEMAGPYDGCLTCQVREVLHAAYPHLLDLAREELAGETSEPETGTPVDTLPLFDLDEKEGR